MARERRLVFGEVAELYDRYRPGYPAALIDDLVALAGLDGRRSVLEVGTGTGKATRLFAQRGIPVVGVEPSAEMAAVARRALAGHENITIERADFETWDPAGRTFPLLFSGQAWHWVARERGYAKAVEVLDPGAVLSAFWNRPQWSRAPLREAMFEVYERAVPGMAPDGPMHPAHNDPGAEESWTAEIEAAPGLGEAEVREYPWGARYTPEQYTGLLATTSDLRLLGEDERAAVLEGLRELIARHGGALELPMVTRLCLARRLG